MSRMQHHAIIVTGNREDIESCRAKAIELFNPVKEGGSILRPGNTGMVGAIQCSPWNSNYSIFISPDGSKEGWEASDLGDTARKTFLDWMRNQLDRPDVDMCVDYLEIAYGGDCDSLDEVIRTSSLYNGGDSTNP